MKSIHLFPLLMPGIVEIFPLKEGREGNLTPQLLDLLIRIQKETIIYSSSWNLSFAVISATLISFIKQSSSNLFFPLPGNRTIFFSLPKSLFCNFIDLVDSLGPRGLLYLLGVRTTLGSVDVLPPERFISFLLMSFTFTLISELLISSFNDLHTQCNHSGRSFTLQFPSLWLRNRENYKLADSWCQVHIDHFD